MDAFALAAMAEVITSCSLVVIILAVTPWGFVWQRYAVARGDRWRATAG